MMAVNGELLTPVPLNKRHALLYQVKYEFLLQLTDCDKNTSVQQLYHSTFILNSEAQSWDYDYMSCISFFLQGTFSKFFFGHWLSPLPHFFLLSHLTETHEPFKHDKKQLRQGIHYYMLHLFPCL